jgi:hypothetical protein
MLTRLFSTIVLLGVAYVVVNSIPDVARYLKIRDL